MLTHTRIRLVPLTALFVAIAACCFAADSTVAADKPATLKWTLEAADGTQVAFPKAGAGKTSIVLFWATWCPYCKALMPHLQAIQYQYGDAVQVFAISIKDDGDPAAFLDKFGYDFVPLPEGDAVAETFGISSTPGVFVVDAEGNVVFDLRDVQVPAGTGPGDGAGHRLKAAHKVPYWVARLRESLPL